MENWLLLAVGIVFLVCMIAGFVKGFLRIGLSLLSTILTLVLVSFLSPYVSDALMKHTPAQDVLEKKIVEAFMPELSADDLLKANLSGTPLENLTVDQIKSLTQAHQTHNTSHKQIPPPDLLPWKSHDLFSW